MQGVSTVELILALVLLVSVVGSTMYYLRAVLPGLEARALASYAFETGAIGSAPLGARVSHAIISEGVRGPRDPRDAAAHLPGPRQYFSVFSWHLDHVPNFDEELEGLIRTLSASSAANADVAETWCIALFDPWQTTLDSCRIGATHVVPGFSEVSLGGACSFAQSLDCLTEQSELPLRAHGCIKADTPGRRPLLVGIYPVDSGQVFASGCAIRTVELPRTFDIRHDDLGS